MEYPKEKKVYFEKYNKKNVDIDMEKFKNLLSPENKCFWFLVSKECFDSWMEKLTVEIFIPNLD